jgi:hypothetical protein
VVEIKGYILKNDVHLAIHYEILAPLIVLLALTPSQFDDEMSFEGLKIA